MDDVRIDWGRIEKPHQVGTEAMLRLLLFRIAAKDKAALKALYYLSGGKLLEILRLAIGDEAATEDVLAEVFVQIWRQAHQFTGAEASPMGWIFEVIRACVRDRLLTNSRSAYCS